MAELRPPLTEKNSEKVRAVSQALNLSLEDAANIIFDAVTEVELAEIITITTKDPHTNEIRRYSKRTNWSVKI